MVQVIQPRDIGAEIGQSIGGGLGKAAEIGAQRTMVGSALDSALAQARDGKQSPFEMLTTMTKAFAGIPGGMQLVGELYPTLRKEMQRDALSKGGQMAFPELTDQMSDSEQMQALINYYMKGALQDPAEAAASAQKFLSLRGDQQRYRIQQTETNRKWIGENVDRSFGADGLSTPLLTSLNAETDQLINQGKNVQQLWPEIEQKYRNAQAQVNSLDNLTGRQAIDHPAFRKLFNYGDPEERMNEWSTKLSEISKIDPTYARQLAQEKGKFGEGEAAEIVKPGSSAYKAYKKSSKARYDRNLNEQGLVAMPGIQEQSQQDLVKFLQKGFNPETDSLLALRRAAMEAGVDDEGFLNAVNIAFPEGVNSPRLSAYNQQELPYLGQKSVPGMAEIWSESWPYLSGPLTAWLFGGKTPQTERAIEVSKGRR